MFTGGVNVNPREVEVLRDAMPEGQESAVIGLADADFGEAVVAIVVLRSGYSLNEAGVKGLVAGQAAKYKAPKRVFFVPELPRNAMGKVQKAVLREQFAVVREQDGADNVSG